MLGKEMSKVSVFIDGSSLYFGLQRNRIKTRVNYYELAKALVGPDRELFRAYYFNSAYDPNLSPDKFQGQQSFLESLEKTPYLETRYGRIFPAREGGFKEKGTDVLMACEMVYHAARGKIDTAVVITENTDLVSALTNVKDLGIHVELALFQDEKIKELIRIADRIIPLKEVFEKFADKINPPKVEEKVEDSVEVKPVK